MTGENGILTKANDASEKTSKVTAKEKVELEVAGSYGTDGRINTESLNENLRNIEGLTSGLPIEFLPATVEVDGYLITILKDGNVVLGKVDGNFDEEKGVNSPKLTNNMQLVIYENGKWVADETNSEYSYEAQTGATDTYNEETGEYGTSHWANAMLDGNYYVWIPRYAYRIDKNTQYTSQSGTSYKIDVKFLVGVTNQYYDENGELKDAKIATNADEISAEGNTDYYVHPAFTFGNTELEGLWIGKYESSDAGSDKIAIVPNAMSLRNSNVSTMFSRAQTLSKTNIDAHMLKNIEWGAVAYLTQSQYGRNGTEVSVNQCSSYITGAGRGIGTEIDNPIYNSTYDSSEITDDQRYNGEIGKLSSTTGNVYGIYDMSGGAYEYVMGVYGINGSPTVGSSGFETFPDSKYYNLYATTSANNTNIGDALYETRGWNSDDADFVDSSYPFVIRGGYCKSTSVAGVWGFYYYNGYNYGIYGFRVCLAVK